MSPTPVLAVDPDDPDPGSIDQAAAVLRAGGLVAFATETVYGLGADATNPSAVARIFEAKGRPPANPLIVHVAEKADALRCVDHWPDRAELLAGLYWPGPLTLVLRRSPLIADLVTAGGDTVGLRVPRPEAARRLIARSGLPIAAPSANRSNRVSPTLARHVLDDLGGRVDLILDAGPTTLGIESTVLDLSGPTPRVLRPGSITLEQIAEALGEPVGGPAPPGGPARSPGQLPIHYAPITPSYRLEPGSDFPSAVDGPFATLVIGDPPPYFPDHPIGQIYRHLAGPDDAAAQFYATLHELDRLGLGFLLIVPPPDESRWRALRDRIRRATRPWTPAGR